jgi:hypothetical protein
LSKEIQTLEQSLVTLNEQLQDLLLITDGRNSPEARRVSSFLSDRQSQRSSDAINRLMPLIV